MRREVFAVLALLALSCAVPAQPLRDLAAARGIRVGAAVAPGYFSEQPYADTLAREFNQAQPENAMKFGLIHPARDTYNWTDADAIAAFAAAHGQALRGHTLVWHNQVPAWLANGGFDSTRMAAILQDHIRTVVGRYAGRVYAWDVVNEAFNNDGTLRGTLWYDTPGIGLSGTGYIEQALRWTRDADPGAKLFYNDYSAEGSNTKSDAIYAMARDFKARGVPLDGIGLQMHFTTSTPSLASMEANIRRLTDLGLEVQITELDVRLPVDASGVASAANLAAQAKIYGDVTALCLKFPLCTAIQTWGFTDRHSWIPSSFAGYGAGLEFDASYQPKPAYDAMAASFKTAPPVIAAGALTNAASYAADAVSPGEIAVLFGATWGPASLQLAPVSGLRLLFDGTPATLIYARVGQASVVVPFSVAGRSSTQLQYEYNGVASNAVAVPLRAAVPGIFTLDSSGHGPGAVLDSAYRVISRDNPARRGDVLQVFATGGGALAADSKLAAPVSATIGGVDCPVQYAGAAPGLIAGAVQVNLAVPAGVPSGEQPLSIAVGGAASQPGVTVVVQ
ncbi:MAG: endo-1,4-beta-xylanase [Acidobacteria bacterium]|nr:endo-1,4-beta-xylanase [Acidobacteriota bacterium]